MPRLFPCVQFKPIAVAMLMFLSSLPAMAARPLASEDAGANPPGQCHIEAWVDWSDGARGQHLAPACGLVDGLELVLEWIDTSPENEQAEGRGLALRWAPEWLGLGDWRFGTKVSVADEKTHPESTGWRQKDAAVMAMATYAMSPEWTLHLNLGRQRDKIEGTSGNTYAAALTWAPHARWLVFAEVLGENRAAASQGAGVRWWALPEQLAFEVTASRTNATADSRTWGVGLGWYGIKF